MSVLLESGSAYANRHEQIRELLPGKQLPWLQNLRGQSYQNFSLSGFPSPREEEWKYTNVSALEKKLFTPLAKGEVTTGASDLLNKFQLPDCWAVVLVNGHYCASLSRLQGLPEGVHIGSLAKALTDAPELVEQYFGKAMTDASAHGFIDFNTAWFADGLFVYVPEKTVLEKPIQLLHITTETDVLATTRHIIALQAQAEAKIIETYVAHETNAYLTAAVSEVFVACNAELSLYKLQKETQKAFHFGGTYVKQERDSRFKQHNFCLGALLARNEVHTDLGLAAECELNGLYVGVKRQHIDNHTRINHRQAHAISREYYKGILDQRARGVFQGRVLVCEDAQKTDSQMNNRNLLLSDFAEADSKPQLEIYADDVKCAHGVTTGQLDEKSIFYLKSRCIDAATARNMLTFAFANEMVDKIDLLDFKKQVLEQLLNHFPQTGIVKEWI